MSLNKIAVIGLDGVSWDILTKVVDSGYTPSLGETLDNSYKLVLESTMPPMTYPAWTSIASDVNPNKHNIFNFYYVEKSLKGFKWRVYSGHEVGYPRIHEIMALYKEKCLVANLPATYFVPSYVSKYCAVVSDWLSPRVKVNISNLYFMEKPFSLCLTEKDSTLSRLRKCVKKRVALITKTLLKAVELIKPRLIFLVFSEFDWIMHKDVEFLKGDIDRYREVVECIDNLIKELKKIGYSIAIVSDHGFHLFKRVVNVKYVLNELGYDAVKPGDFWKRKPIWKRFALNKIVKNVVKNVFRILKRSEHLIYERYIEADIFISESQFAQPLYVNPRIEVDKLVYELYQRYSHLFRILKGEEVYNRSYNQLAPDIILYPSTNNITLAAEIDEARLWVERQVADHHPEGVFSLEYSNCKSFDKVKAWNVLPFLLSSMGLSIPQDMDIDVDLLDLLDKYGFRYRLDKPIKPRWLLLKRLYSKLY